MLSSNKTSSVPTCTKSGGKPVKLAKSGESGLGATMFVTHAPCIDCAKLVYQSGIATVYYKNEYRSTQGLVFLNKSGVEVIHHRTLEEQP